MFSLALCRFLSRPEACIKFVCSQNVGVSHLTTASYDVVLCRHLIQIKYTFTFIFRGQDLYVGMPRWVELVKSYTNWFRTGFKWRRWLNGIYNWLLNGWRANLLSRSTWNSPRILVNIFFLHRCFHEKLFEHITEYRYKNKWHLVNDNVLSKHVFLFLDTW